MSKLYHGIIRKGTTCPYSDDCGENKTIVCNGQGCPAGNGKIVRNNFSCGLARLIDMVKGKD